MNNEEGLVATQTDTFGLMIRVLAMVGMPAVAFAEGLGLNFAILFLVVAGIMTWSARKIEISVIGAILAVAISYYTRTDFRLWYHLSAHDFHELKLLGNIFSLLFVFEIASMSFKHSGIPAWLPRILPDGVWGGTCVLLIVAVLSSFLDNIGAALIGASIASSVYKNRQNVHISFIVGIVLLSNAGGAWSVIGDTTTTMMWISGISQWDLDHAISGSVITILIGAPLFAWLQHRHFPIASDLSREVVFHKRELVLVGLIIAGAIIGNVLADLPGLGAIIGVLIAWLVFRINPSWRAAAHQWKSAVFIVSLMLIASLVSIEGWFHPGIMHDYYNGVISALFDNIPLTKMLIDQGGHDYGVLAFAVGVGGSITNFGSSAAIALWADFPEARKFGAWIPWGLLVLVIFTISYFGMVAIVDYHPTLEGVSEFAG